MKSRTELLFGMQLTLSVCGPMYNKQQRAQGRALSNSNRYCSWVRLGICQEGFGRPPFKVPSLHDTNEALKETSPPRGLGWIKLPPYIQSSNVTWKIVILFEGRQPLPCSHKCFFIVTYKGVRASSPGNKLL